MSRRGIVLLVPGLFSPRWLMWGLRRRLERHGFDASIWDDASVFGSIDASIEQLQRRLRHSAASGVVTHSFGDWLFRQAVAHGALRAVRSLVSLVPVMSSSIVARMLTPLGRIVPEIAVMASEERAASELQTPPGIDRLIVWSRIDPWVPRITEFDSASTRCVVVGGAHNTILWQPKVQRLTIDHLCKNE